MTDDKIALRELLEKGSDTTFLREMIGFAAQRLMELETDGLGRLRFTVRDDLKRTWARETRLERQEKQQEGTTPQLTGKHAPPAR